MRVLSFFVTLLILIQAKEEEYSDLENYINDPAIWKYIVKRIGSKGDSPVKAEKSSDDDDDEYRASFGKHAEQKQTKQPPKPSPPSPLDSMVDSLGNLCQYKPNASVIIRSRASIDNGASFLKSFEDKTRGECVNACCYTQGCNLVVYENKGKHNCYLFNCGSPSLCLFAVHNNYTTMSFPNHAIPDVASIGDKAQHENELAGLNAKTTVPTAPKPRKKVPLYSKCDIDWNDECSDSNAKCRDNLCKCSQGFHAKYGICRKNCNDDSFECENKGQRWNVPECISKQHVCDGTPQCADGSDEENCEALTTSKPTTVISPAHKGVPDQSQNAPATNQFGAPYFQPPDYLSRPNQYNSYYWPKNYQPSYPSQNSLQSYNQFQQGSAYPLDSRYYQGKQPNNLYDSHPDSGIYSHPNQADARGNDQIPRNHIQDNSDNSQWKEKSRLPANTGHSQDSSDDKDSQMFIGRDGSLDSINQKNVGIRVTTPDMLTTNNLKPSQKAEDASRWRGDTGLKQSLDRNSPSENNIHQSSINRVSQKDDPRPDSSPHRDKLTDSQRQSSKPQSDWDKPYNSLPSWNRQSYLDQIGNKDNKDSSNSWDNQGSISLVKTPDLSAKDVPSSSNPDLSHSKPAIQKSKDSYGNLPSWENSMYTESQRPLGTEEDKSKKGSNSGDGVDDNHGQVKKIKHKDSSIFQDPRKSEERKGKPIEEHQSHVKLQQSSSNIQTEQKMNRFRQNGGHRQGVSKSSGQRLKTAQSSNNHFSGSTSQSGGKTGTYKQESSARKNQGTERQGQKFSDGRKQDFDRQGISSGRNQGFDRQELSAGMKQDVNRQRQETSASRNQKINRHRQGGYRRPTYSRQRPHHNQYYNDMRATYPYWNNYDYYYDEDRKFPTHYDSFDADHGEFPDDNGAGGIDTDKDWPDFSKDKIKPEPHHKGFFDPDSSGKEKTQSKVVKNDKANNKITDTSVLPHKEAKKVPIKTTPNPYAWETDNITPKQTKAGKKDNPTPKRTKAQKTEQLTTSATKVKTDIPKPIKNSTKLEAVDSSNTLNDAEETRVVVESPTDSNQGPIVALALGLGITVILLFFVGCRLRNVKRRLRKGRALHSNEADYLINGMYL